jgi:exopolyphosphatase/guanosine-5'-triphosphate,3'-diphosphate pyrophosphatase
MRVAAIDIGSNAVRLIIAEVQHGTLTEIIHTDRIITRLGNGLKNTGRISEESAMKTLIALQKFAKAAEEHKAGKLAAVATSAVRECSNRDDLLIPAREIGVNINVIDGETEAALELAGVQSGIETGGRRTLIFDIGGGSTEFIYIEPNVPAKVISIPLGVVKMADSCNFRDVCIEEHMDRIRIPLFTILNDVRKEMDFQPELLIGSAGTPTTLAAVDLEMKEYDWRKINGYPLKKSRIEQIFTKLCSLTAEERLLLPGMEKGREDLLIPGTLITLELMSMTGTETLTVSDFGLREGLAVAAANN